MPHRTDSVARLLAILGTASSVLLDDWPHGTHRVQSTIGLVARLWSTSCLPGSPELRLELLYHFTCNPKLRPLAGTVSNHRLHWPQELEDDVTRLSGLPMSASEDSAIPVCRRFASTHWSIVVAAGQRDSPGSEAALAKLCQLYWYPLYAYARRRLPCAEDAQDRTQAFFAELLEKEYLRQADRARGRFRSFLLTAFQHFLARQHEREQAKKRGGGRGFLTLDFETGEQRYHREPFHEATAEALYERGWALTLLEQGLARLREELASAGKEHLFDCLKGTLTVDGAARPYPELAAELGMSSEALKVAVHRLRRRYREIVRADIAQTVTTPEEVEDELRDLFAAVRVKKH